LAIYWQLNHSSFTIQGLVERVVVIFYDKDHIPIEKFVFKLAVSQTYGSNLEQSSLEFALRAFLIKLTVAEPLTKPLPSGSRQNLFLPSLHNRHKIDISFKSNKSGNHCWGEFIRDAWLPCGR
jgi:hypothetical protein